MTAGWCCGPGTDAAFAAWTVSTVAALPHTVGSLETVLSCFASKRDGQRLRAALAAALNQARSIVGTWLATGQLPADEDRDLIDALARLCRRIDRQMEGGRTYPPDGLGAVFCDEDPGGEITPFHAVRLAAHRLPNDRGRRHGRGGPWRTHHRDTQGTPDLVLAPVGSGTLERSGSAGGVEMSTAVAGLLAHLGMAGPATDTAPPPASREARSLVERVVLRASDRQDAEHGDAAVTVQAWLHHALAWWTGPVPEARSVTDPAVRGIIAAWIDDDPVRARGAAAGGERR